MSAKKPTVVEMIDHFIKKSEEFDQVNNLVAGVKKGMHVNAADNTPQVEQNIFDLMTRHGFKLDLITGRYFKP